MDVHSMLILGETRHRLPAILRRSRLPCEISLHPRCDTILRAQYVQFDPLLAMHFDYFSSRPENMLYLRITTGDQRYLTRFLYNFAQQTDLRISFKHDSYQLFADDIDLHQSLLEQLEQHRLN